MQRCRAIALSFVTGLTACAGSIEPSPQDPAPPRSSGGSTPGRAGSTPGLAGSSGPAGSTPGPAGSTPAGGSNPVSGQPTAPGITPLPPGTDFACASQPQTRPPGQRLWRLTPKQYANTLAVALSGRRSMGTSPFTAPAGFVAPLEPVVDSYRFGTFSGTHGITNFEFGQSVTVSEEMGRKLVESVRTGTCWPTSTGPASDACAETLIKDKGAILFRRELTPAEVTRYGGIAKANTAMFGRDDALAIAFQAMVIAPQFVFLTELGDPVSGSPGLSKLSSYEVASAISYVLTDGPADTLLWDAATKGMLRTPEQINVQVTRVLESPAAVPAREFVTQYFKLQKVLGVAKAIEKPGEYNRERVLQDARMLVDNVYSTNRRKDFLKTLLTTSMGFAGADSYKLYGLAADPKSTTAVALPATERAGLLTHPAFLAGLASFEETLPIKRGRFINESLLCRPVPDVPIDVVAKLPSSKSTMREKLAVHSKIASCATCHMMLDPVGLALEKYDAAGKFRATQFGKTIEAGGMLTGTVDADGPFKDAVEMSRLLGGSVTVEQCFIRHGFQYVMGRPDDAVYDKCSIDAAAKAYAAGGGDFVGAVAAMFSSPSFLNRSY